MEDILANTLHLALDSAPWLLLGLLAAGLIHAWLPVEKVGSALGGSGIGAVSRAALIGAPLPLCSCGTLPAAISLRRSGASRAATTSFLVATPETGVDSIALSWVMLGPVMALLRPIAALLSAVVAGLIVGRWDHPEDAPGDRAGVAADSACCETSCCAPPAGKGSQSSKPGAIGFLGRSLDGVRYAFSDLLDDLSLWLALGILVAGVVVTLVPADLLSTWGSGPVAMLLILLISVPMYVCATASTPLAHAMLFAGISPGTVLVFLLAGPASNIASIALVHRELGRRALAGYLCGVAGVSLLLGLGLDAMVSLADLDLLVGDGSSTVQELPVTISVLSLLVLVVAACRPIRRFFVHGKARPDGGCCG